MTLKTLEQHNEEVHKKAFEPHPRPNGIACPLCGNELLDTTGVVLYTYPGQRSVKCSTCEWTGTRATL